MRPIIHRLAMQPPPERRAVVRQASLVGLVLALILVGWAAWWQTAREIVPDAAAAGRTAACGLPRFPAGTHVVLVGAAGGGGGSAFAVPGRHAARTGEVDLLVTARTAPVHLVLIGQDPIIWRLGLAPGVGLAGVTVLAPRPQVVDGVPDEVAVRRLIGPVATAACQLAVSDLHGGRNRVRTALGRDPDSVQVAGPGFATAERPRVVVGPAPRTAAALAQIATDATVARLVPRRGNFGEAGDAL